MTDAAPPPTATPQRPNLGDAFERLRPNWGWFVALGLVTAALGVATLGYLSVVGTIASVYMIGFAMIVAGGAEIALGMKARSWGWTALWILVGLLYILGGAFAIAQPLVAAATFTLLIGAALVATGVLRIAAALRAPEGKGMLAFAGLITLALGAMILLAWPVSGLFTLGIFLGVDLLIYGLSWISFGLRLRPKG
mgnify:CR=1 FL=1